MFINPSGKCLISADWETRFLNFYLELPISTQWAERLNSRTLGRIFTKKGAQVVVKSLLEGYL